MLDLENDSLENYWAAVAPAAPFIIAAMDASEDWRHDQAVGDTETLRAFFSSLPQMWQQVHSSTKKNEFLNDLVIVLAYLPSSKALYFVYWLEQEFAALGFGFLRELNRFHQQAELTEIDVVAFNLFRNRLRFFKKTIVLQTVFAPERLAACNAALSQG